MPNVDCIFLLYWIILWSGAFYAKICNQSVFRTKVECFFLLIWNVVIVLLWLTRIYFYYAKVEYTFQLYQTGVFPFYVKVGWVFFMKLEYFSLCQSTIYLFIMSNILRSGVFPFFFLNKVKCFFLMRWNGVFLYYNNMKCFYYQSVSSYYTKVGCFHFDPERDISFFIPKEGNLF